MTSVNFSRAICGFNWLFYDDFYGETIKIKKKKKDKGPPYYS